MSYLSWEEFIERKLIEDVLKIHKFKKKKVTRLMEVFKFYKEFVKEK